MSGPEIVNSIAGLLIITSILVVEAKQLTRAVTLYSLQSLVLVSVFVALATVTGAWQLYLWALTAFVTKVVLTPVILYRTVRKFDQDPALPSAMGPAASIVLAALIVALSVIVVAPIRLPGAEAFKPAFAVSLAHFFLGLACIITQRNIIKQIFGYCLMENGSHLTLALMANQASELIEIGIATDAIFAVIVMSVIGTRIQRTLHTLDSCELASLKG